MTRFYALFAVTLLALGVFVAVAASNTWHTPTTHEHGDAPTWAEAWSLATFGHGVIYGADESTPHELETKEFGFKGYTLRLKAINGTYVDVYLRLHESSNVLDRGKRFHSYEAYLRDATGSISFFQGWLDRGDPAVARFPSNSPIVLDSAHNDPLIHTPHGWVGVVTVASWNAGSAYRIETWYSRNMDWAPDVVSQILDPTTRYKPGETLDDAQPTWDVTGLKGVKRRVALYWYGRDSVRYPTRNANGPQGWFCALPVGTIVACGTPGSLDEFISPSLPSMEQAVWTNRTYSGAGISVPN